MANTAVLCTHVGCLPVGGAPGKCYYNTLLRCQEYFSSSSVVSLAFSVLCVYSIIEHHPYSLCVKFSFFHGRRCWASPWRKIAYSITHSPSLFDAPGTETCASEQISLLFTFMRFYTVSQKVPTFKLFVTLSNLNHFQNVCAAGKRITFATKLIQHYPPYLTHVATIPWEIENSSFLQIFSRYGRKYNKLYFKKLPTFKIRLSASVLCTPSNTNFLSKSCRRWIQRWLLTNTAVISAVTNF